MTPVEATEAAGTHPSDGPAGRTPPDDSPDGHVGTSWSGTYTYRAARLVDASTVNDVRRAVRQWPLVRALGSRHSFNDVADTAGTLVSVLGIPPEPSVHRADDETTVTVGAGARYGQLAHWLDQRGLALHNTGSLPHISVGGAIATGTHGSGSRNGNLSTAVRALEYVDAAGELVRVDRRDASFPAFAVGLGAFGIVVRATLAVQPSYRIRQDVYTDVPWEQILLRVRDVFDSAYSVSVFVTDWSAPAVRGAWVKRRLEHDEVVPEWFGGQRARTHVPILATPDPNGTVQGVLAPWHHALPHFRIDAEPSSGEEIQSEWFVDLRDAVRALEAIRSIAAVLRPALLVSELRSVAADDIWLSPAAGRDSLAIHFTWTTDASAVAVAVAAVERALTGLGARPHWGKVHATAAPDLERAYPRLADARAVFDRCDPEGKFSSAALERWGIRGVRALPSVGAA